MRPGKANRVPEGKHHGSFCQILGVPMLAKITAPATTEAGDMVWLDAKTLLVGHGYRTNAQGIQQMRALLKPKGVEVLTAPLPHGPGPAACLHLMSLISLIDEKTVLVDLPWLAVETVELLRTRGHSLIEIDYSERDTLACNVLSLGEKRVLVLEENAKTNQKLRAAGFDVRTFPGSELCASTGSGGCHLPDQAVASSVGQGVSHSSVLSELAGCRVRVRTSVIGASKSASGATKTTYSTRSERPSIAIKPNAFAHWLSVFLNG